MKILLIDDDATFRERLALSLRRRGHEVWTADDGDALGQAGDVSPDGVLLDLRMPGEGGLALIPQLRELCAHARIIMLTGYGSIATAMEAIRQGAADYLTKPASLQQILTALEGRPQEAEEETPSLDRVEWEHLQRVLADCDNNISKTARVLGIDRRSLQRKLAKYAPSR
ncbi:response regulator [Ruficoccus amylovorans]|uniref:Response regulator n=1 Tax=Ruficoccus amylovorans TaxID=1804625 RepID=A0A842HG29_9BACT|nr:response regulator [Ruficoccus amylovorans]MBC2595229.1 response regulator [Ruficoccus amylovorans]